MLKIKIRFWLKNGIISIQSKLIVEYKIWFSTINREIKARYRIESRSPLRNNKKYRKLWLKKIELKFVNMNNPSQEIKV